MTDFASMHTPGDPLLLPNAWDVASAVVIADAGARAIATTSAGVAWAAGVPDGADLGAEEMARLVERITALVDVPVTVDIEAGYADIADTVTSVLQAGAVGVNIEDRVGSRMFTPDEQAARLGEARAAAEKLHLPLWINARTDLYLIGSGTLEAAQERAEAYRGVADSLFVPGLVDLGVIAELAKGPMPVSVMAWAGAPSVAEFAEAGVVRISLGSAIAQSAYAVAARATTEMLTKGTYDETGSGLDYGKLNTDLTRKR
jgi:2-methylisocitrate lyase-like PEP mutase family enzyme